MKKPYAQIVCWSCRRGNITLRNVKDELGFKTEDYICERCLLIHSPTPPIGNSSRIYFPKDEEKKEKKVPPSAMT